MTKHRQLSSMLFGWCRNKLDVDYRPMIDPNLDLGHLSHVFWMSSLEIHSSTREQLWSDIRFNL